VYKKHDTHPPPPPFFFLFMCHVEEVRGWFFFWRVDLFLYVSRDTLRTPRTRRNMSRPSLQAVFDDGNGNTARIEYAWRTALYAAPGLVLLIATLLVAFWCRCACGAAKKSSRRRVVDTYTIAGTTAAAAPHPMTSGSCERRKATYYVLVACVVASLAGVVACALVLHARVQSTQDDAHSIVDVLLERIASVRGALTTIYAAALDVSPQLDAYLRTNGTLARARAQTDTEMAYLAVNVTDLAVATASTAFIGAQADAVDAIRAEFVTFLVLNASSTTTTASSDVNTWLSAYTDVLHALDDATREISVQRDSDTVQRVRTLSRWVVLPALLALPMLLFLIVAVRVCVVRRDGGDSDSDSGVAAHKRQLLSASRPRSDANDANDDDDAEDAEDASKRSLMDSRGAHAPYACTRKLATILLCLVAVLSVVLLPLSVVLSDACDYADAQKAARLVPDSAVDVERAAYACFYNHSLLDAAAPATFNVSRFRRLDAWIDQSRLTATIPSGDATLANVALPSRVTSSRAQLQTLDQVRTRTVVDAALLLRRAPDTVVRPLFDTVQGEVARVAFCDALGARVFALLDAARALANVLLAWTLALLALAYATLATLHIKRG
jgi:hypothetical protein